MYLTFCKQTPKPAGFLSLSNEFQANLSEERRVIPTIPLFEFFHEYWHLIEVAIFEKNLTIDVCCYSMFYRCLDNVPKIGNRIVKSTLRG